MLPRWAAQKLSFWAQTLAVLTTPCSVLVRWVISTTPVAVPFWVMRIQVDYSVAKVRHCMVGLASATCKMTPIGSSIDATILTMQHSVLDWSTGSPTVLRAAPVAAAALPVVIEQAVEPEPKEPAPALPLQIPFVYFEFDKSDLSIEAKSELDEFAGQIVDSNLQLMVEGHTDWIAPEAYNMSLSVRRAEAVANYLEGQGIAGERLTIMGYGETRPVSDNNTADGRALNRRAEILVR